jgi:phosphoribosylformylglycinamidine synthase
MRDTHATGTGSIMGAGTAGYCVGNLLMDEHKLPGEDPAFVSNMLLLCYCVMLVVW